MSGEAAAGAGTAALSGQGGGLGQGAQGAGAQGAQDGQGGGQQPWFGGFDADTRGWLDNRGYSRESDLAKVLPEMIKAHRNAESMIGQRDRMVLWPRDSADKEGWAAIHKRMGVPEKWEDYGLVPLNADGTPNDKADRTYANGMAQVFQKFGVGKEAAAAIAGEHSKLSAALNEAADNAFKNQSAQEFDALRKEWGGEADTKFAASQRAARAFGIAPETMGKIERAIGTKSMLSLLSNIGLAISEDFRGSGAGSGSGNGLMTPEAANARLVELRGDREWTKRYFAGDTAAVAEYDRLINVVASRTAA